MVNAFRSQITVTGDQVDIHMDTVTVMGMGTITAITMVILLAMYAVDMMLETYTRVKVLSRTENIPGIIATE